MPTAGRAIILMLLSGLCACDAAMDALGRGPRYENYALMGEEAPRFVDETDGVEYPRPADATIVEFWGLWCPACHDDAPAMQRIRAQYEAAPGVEVLAIHSGGFGRWPSLEAYFAEVGYAFETVLDPDHALAERYAVEMYPTYLVLDSEGRVTTALASLARMNGEQRLIEAVDAALARAD